MDIAIRWILSGSAFYSNIFGCVQWFGTFVLLFTLIFSLHHRSTMLTLLGAIFGALFVPALNLIPLELGRKILPVVDALQSPVYATQGIILLAAMALFFLWFVMTLVSEVGRIATSAPPLERRVKPQSLRRIEAMGFQMFCVGFVLLTAGMLMLSYWELGAWGTAWSFDFADSTLFFGYLTYALFFHFRYLLHEWETPEWIRGLVRLPIAGLGLMLVLGHYFPWNVWMM